MKENFLEGLADVKDAVCASIISEENKLIPEAAL